VNTNSDVAGSEVHPSETLGKKSFPHPAAMTRTAPQTGVHHLSFSHGHHEVVARDVLQVDFESWRTRRHYLVLRQAAGIRGSERETERVVSDEEGCEMSAASER
jgi:hypothetical protein